MFTSANEEREYTKIVSSKRPQHQQIKKAKNVKSKKRLKERTQQDFYLKGKKERKNSYKYIDIAYE